MTTEKFEHPTAKEGFGIVRLELQRPVIAGKGVVKTLQGGQCVSTVIECFGVIRLDRQGPVVADKGVVETLQVLECIATVII